MDFTEKITFFTDLVHKQARKFIALEQKNPTLKLSPPLKKYFSAFAESVANGKCLRAALVLMGYQLAGKKISQAIVDVALAVEVVHSALLAQDDIMDKSLMRRGKPSLFQTFGGDHFGISQAICLGDLGQQLGIKIILRSKFLDKQKQSALEFFTNIIINTIYGQILDEHFTKQKPKSEKEILNMYYLKTAQYTFLNPLVLGYTLGGSKKLLGKLEKFSKNLGIAYQIQDDILGIFGQEKILGKSVTSDIKEGKNTLLYLYCYLAADKDEKEVFNCYYGNEKLTDAQASQIKNLMKKYSLEKCQKMVEKYFSIAKKILPEFSELCDFLIIRDK